MATRRWTSVTWMARCCKKAVIMARFSGCLGGEVQGACRGGEMGAAGVPNGVSGPLVGVRDVIRTLVMSRRGDGCCVSATRMGRVLASVVAALVVGLGAGTGGSAAVAQTVLEAPGEGEAVAAFRFAETWLRAEVMPERPAETVVPSAAVVCLTARVDGRVIARTSAVVDLATDPTPLWSVVKRTRASIAARRGLAEDALAAQRVKDDLRTAALSLEVGGALTPLGDASLRLLGEALRTQNYGTVVSPGLQGLAALNPRDGCFFRQRRIE